MGTRRGRTTLPRSSCTFDARGNARMVDVSEKAFTSRMALATGIIEVSPEVFDAIEGRQVRKGDVLDMVQMAGIVGCKRTSELIPLCHLLSLTNATLSFELCPEHHSIRAFCRVRTSDKTDVEMEALTGVSVALLIVYDICKAIDERMVVRDVHLVEKTGGTSESFQFWKPCSGPLFIREISFMK
ncbi:cyclic pyranopterin monophosphate synthase MoaC [Olsenella profusa]|nr:cyclic pyranopterin monophosphate synthase MoaC [Olsenella profusa]